MNRFAKWAVAGGTVVAVAVGAAAALAGTGVGGIFNLGVTNSVDATSTLTGSATDAMLDVRNTSEASDASAVSGRLDAPSPGVASAGVRGSTQQPTVGAAVPLTYGVWGSSTGEGAGVLATSERGPALWATTAQQRPAIVAESEAGQPGIEIRTSGPPLRVTSTTKVDNLHADNASNLGGVPASGYQQRCRAGAIWGYAKVQGTPTFPSTYTTDQTRVYPSFSCPGTAVSVRRLSTGNYYVDFGTHPPHMLVGSVQNDFDDFVTWARPWDPTVGRYVYQVVVRASSGAAEDRTFVVMAFE